MTNGLSIEQQRSVLANDLVAVNWVRFNYPEYSMKTIYRHLENVKEYRIDGSSSKFYRREDVKAYFDSLKVTLFDVK